MVQFVIDNVLIMLGLLSVGLSIGVGIAVGMEISMRLSGDSRTVVLTWARTKNEDPD